MKRVEHLRTEAGVAVRRRSATTQAAPKESDNVVSAPLKRSMSMSEGMFDMFDSAATKTLPDDQKSGTSMSSLRRQNTMNIASLAMLHRSDSESESSSGSSVDSRIAPEERKEKEARKHREHNARMYAKEDGSEEVWRQRTHIYNMAASMAVESASRPSQRITVADLRSGEFSFDLVDLVGDNDDSDSDSEEDNNKTKLDSSHLLENKVRIDFYSRRSKFGVRVLSHFDASDDPAGEEERVYGTAEVRRAWDAYVLAKRHALIITINLRDPGSGRLRSQRMNVRQLRNELAAVRNRPEQCQINHAVSTLSEYNRNQRHFQRNVDKLRRDKGIATFLSTHDIDKARYVRTHAPAHDGTGKLVRTMSSVQDVSIAAQ